MGVFKNIFTWWEGATFGTWLNTWTNGALIGEDPLGNRYYQARRQEPGLRRRWVIYAGSNDASRVPPEWHGWLHNTFDDTPDKALGPARDWETAPYPNLTGTNAAYKPSGALETGGNRARSTGDYEAWSPEVR